MKNVIIRDCQSINDSALQPCRIGWLVNRGKRCILWAVLVAVLSSPVLHGQVITSTVTGSVTDKTSAMIPDAIVTLTEVNTGTTREQKTNSLGRFAFPQLEPGSYSVRIVKPGFEAYELANIVVNSTSEVSLGALKLLVGKETMTVVVEAGATSLDKDSPNNDSTLGRQDLEEIPMRSHDIMEAITLLPGMTDDNAGQRDQPNSNSVANIYTNGIRSSSKNVMIDGQSSMDPGSGANVNNLPSVDMVQEIHVSASNYRADSGRNAGPTVTIITRGGSQQFHGSLDFPFRNEDMNANNRDNKISGVARPKYRLLLPTATISGPVIIPHVISRQRKLSFFYSQTYQLSTTDIGLKYNTFPTAAERSGDFSASYNSTGSLTTVKDPSTGVAFANNTIPSSRLTTLGQQVLNLFPLPTGNITVAGVLQGNYALDPSGELHRQVYSGRLDWQPNDKVQLFVRATYTPEREIGPYGSVNGVSVSSSSFPITTFTYFTLAKGISFGSTQAIRQNLINNVSAGVTFAHKTSSATDPSKITIAGTGIQLPSLYASAPTNGILPNLTFGGASINNQPSFSQNANFPDNQIVWDTNITDNLSYVAGKHIASVGIFLEFVHDQVTASDYQNGSNTTRGTYSFSQDSNNAYDSGNPFANALLGSVDAYTQFANNPTGHVHYSNLEFYVQDEWKIVPRLTISGGLRFYHDPAPVERNNQLAAFVPSLWTAANAPTILRPSLSGSKKIAIDPTNGAQYPYAYVGLLAPSSAAHYFNGLMTAGSNGVARSVYTVDSLYFTPRLGLNYALFPKTVLKGGGGIYYDRIPLETTFRLLTNPPVALSSTIDYTTFDQLASAGSSGLNGVPTVYTLPTGHQRLPVNYGYSFEIQQQIGLDTLFGVAYVGSQSRHLNQTYPINPIPVGARFVSLNPQNADPTNIGKPLADNFLRTYQGIGTLYERKFAGASSYNSLQIQATSRLRRYNLTLRGNYTLGRAWGTASQEYNIAPSYPTSVNGFFAAGPLTYDVRNTANFWFIYNFPQLTRLLPWRNFETHALGAAIDGWELSGNVPYSSGRGFTPSYSITGNPEISGSSDAAVINLVNPSAPANQGRWGAPLVYTFGHSGCNACLRGPSYYNFNISLTKNFRIHEHTRFMLRTEAYNLFNDAIVKSIDQSLSFASPGSSINLNPNFGTPRGLSSAYQRGRILQLDAKISF